MRLFFTFIIFFCTGIALRAQNNLVPNPSFEVTQSCNIVQNNSIIYVPAANFNNIATYPAVEYWLQPSIGSPDYYNSCATPSMPSFNVPSNMFGNQAARTGKAYVGMFAYNVIGPTNFPAEYVETKLNSPMIAGHEYYISYFINLATGWLSNCAGVDNMGATFSDVQIYSTSPAPRLPLTRTSIINPSGNYVTDTSGWVRIDGLYTAIGNEQWMVVGALERAANPPYIAVVNNKGNVYYSYYYVDDVSVIDLDSAQRSSTTIDICTTDTLYTNHNGNYTLHNTHTGTYYLWSTGDTTQSIMATQPGDYWVRTIFDSAAYVDTIHFNVHQPVVLGKPLTDTLLCRGDTLIIGTDYIYDQYRWNTGDTTAKIAVYDTGKYVLQVLTIACGMQQDSMQLQVRDLQSPVVSDTFACIGAPAPSIRVTGDSIKWYITPTGVAYKNQPYVSTSKIDTLTLYATTTNFCGEGPKVPVHIIVLPKKPEVTITTSSQDTVCIGDIITLQASSNIPVAFLWSTGDTGTAITINKQDEYTVIGTEACGSDTATSRQYVFKNCDACLNIPNAFTPNGDGKNDVFRAITYCNIGSFLLVIYDRWGNAVYKSTSVADSWDGTNNGRPMEIGTYFYVLNYTTATTHPYNKSIKGDITLIR